MSETNALRLRDVASVIRSKNAGPLYLTLDIIFKTQDDFERVRKSGILGADVVGPLLGTSPEQVRVVDYAPALAIKITFPRPNVSGDLDDTDVFGAQQHAPILELSIS